MTTKKSAYGKFATKSVKPQTVTEPAKGTPESVNVAYKHTQVAGELALIGSENKNPDPSTAKKIVEEGLVLISKKQLDDIDKALMDIESYTSPYSTGFSYTDFFTRPGKTSYPSHHKSWSDAATKAYEGSKMIRLRIRQVRNGVTTIYEAKRGAGVPGFRRHKPKL